MALTILAEQQDGLLLLTLNRPDKRNALNTDMYLALTGAFQQAAQDESVHVVLLQGQQECFTAGNDLADFMGKSSLEADDPILQFLHTLADFPKPVIAAVGGPAVGIGTTLLLHCDLVYAGDNAAFSMPFVNLGLCPEAASSLLVPQMFGYHRAAEALLLGEPFMAEAAQEVGLVNRVLAPSECNRYAREQALKLAAKPLSSLITTKQLMKGAGQQAVLERMAEEGAHFGRMLGEPAAREAMTAFMEKRKPDFSKV